MAGYQYLIAGLPDLKTDLGQCNFDYASTLAEIRELCPQTGIKLIDWLEAGFEESHLNETFYRSIKRTGNRFLMEYFAFDRNVRTAKVAFLEEKKYENDEFGEQDELKSIFAEGNIIEREKKLDLLYWKKIDDIIVSDLFDIDVVLAFIAKAKIVSRWCALDPKRGAELFSELVKEVRGTFKGVNYDSETK